MLPKEAKVYKHVLKYQLNASDSNQQVLCATIHFTPHSNNYINTTFVYYTVCSLFKYMYVHN